MKTTIEVHGFEIKIDEMEDKVLVSAMKDGETIEEFELDVEGFEDEGDDMGGMDAFGEEGDEEEDFGGEEEDGDDDMEEEDDDMEEDEDEGKLESFSHFVKKRKK